jgi:hypothetical protein
VIPAGAVLSVSDFLQFHKSLVIAVCNSDCHLNFSDRSKPAEGYHFVHDTPSQQVSRRELVKVPEKDSVTIDLHTKTALIGREDVDVSLGFLRLQDEEIGGCIDIYAVPRILEDTTSASNVHSMESLYRVSNSWVRRFPKTKT